MNTYITELSSLVPACSASTRKLDKLTVLRMAVQRMRALNGLWTVGIWTRYALFILYYYRRLLLSSWLSFFICHESWSSIVPFRCRTEVHRPIGNYDSLILCPRHIRVLWTRYWYFCELQAAEGFLFVVGCNRGRMLYVSQSVAQVLGHSQVIIHHIRPSPLQLEQG